MLFQQQWKKHSKTNDFLDNAVSASLPPDNDELDGRLAMAQRLDNAQSAAPAWGPAGVGAAAEPHEEEPALKRRKLSAGQRAKKRVAALEAELALAKPRKGQGKEGKGKGKDKGKGKRPDEPARRNGQNQWCRNFIQGGCSFGDRCWFRHE